ncbi:MULTISPECIES: DegV family protein [Sporosarcina]|uniref:EDD domain protein, DegV family n=2 Tax=Sporosarcina newyorkensis TaxID=759851 RepID=A0A1T4Y397_9BACL|nr:MULTISPECIES: DegV family protein [Sporosarcina]EGQ27178.1 DegV family protein [Sporosarcina newyorkensis 2681]MBY0221719.1 DegV family protein [Sporosarcina aquimarina]SKA96103.1 EDD domain protein, DegV family [Sporosarcina newyorkensis]
MKIFADSACDLPISFFEENEVELFPLSVLLNGNEYEDIVEINSKEIFDAIRKGQQPKTSQVSLDTMIKTWKDLAASGEDGIYIAFSSQLSGTYQTAVMASDQVKEGNPSMNLVLIDSRCASLGYGLLVKEAVRLRKEGLDVREIERKIRAMASHMEHLFTVEDLDYLAKGGRVSKASAFFGGLLNIKPLLHVEGGKLVPIEKHRGRKKVFRRMIEIMEERGSNLEEQTIAISHGDDLATANEFKAMIEEVIQPKAIEIHQIGSVIGSHAGPGTIALFFLNKVSST